eukprot:8424568-Alexandrium_andersonii.AAC.1
MFLCTEGLRHFAQLSCADQTEMRAPLSLRDGGARERRSPEENSPLARAHRYTRPVLYKQPR